MLELAATSIAISQLRKLKSDHPELFSAVSTRLQELRVDPGGRYRGRTFLLDDGSAARLATIFDVDTSADLAIVWKVELADGAETGRLFVLRVEFVGSFVPIRPTLGR